jgi:exodeoxyribonuclease VII large subunit
MVADLGRRLFVQRTKFFDDRRNAIKALARALPSPKDLLGLNTQKLDDFSERLPMALLNTTRQKSIYLNRLAGGLSIGNLKQSVSFNKERLSSGTRRLLPTTTRALVSKKDQLHAVSRVLDSLSYQKVLDRGYAMVRDGDGELVANSKCLSNGDKGEILFADGAVNFNVMGDEVSNLTDQKKIKKLLPRKPKAKKLKSEKHDDTNQGSLF